MPPVMQQMVASSPGHSQIASRTRGEKLGEGLGSLLCHRLRKWWTRLVNNVNSVHINRDHNFQSVT